MHFAVGGGHFVYHVGRGDDDGLIELPLQAFLHDLHMQQPQKAAAEAKAQGRGGLRLIDQRGVVQHQLLQGDAQVLEVLGIHRVDPGKDHWLHLAVAGQRLGSGFLGVGHSVAHFYVAHVLGAADQVAHFTG